MGVASKDGFRNYATNPTKLPGKKSDEFDFDSPVTDYLVKHVYTLALNSKKGMPTIGLLSRVLDISPFVVIGNEASDGGKQLVYFFKLPTTTRFIEAMYLDYSWL